MEKEVSGKRFFQALNERDFEIMETLLAADAELHFPKTQTLVGKQRIMKFLRLLFRQYPQLVFTIHRIIQQDDFMVVHWSNRGRNRHAEPYENEGITLIELSGRRIRFISDFFKDTEKF